MILILSSHLWMLRQPLMPHVSPGHPKTHQPRLYLIHLQYISHVLTYWVMGMVSDFYANGCVTFESQSPSCYLSRLL